MQLYDGALEVDEESIRKIEGAHVIDDSGSIEDMTIERQWKSP